MGAILISLAPILSAEATDPIDGLVARLSSTHGLWLNGIIPHVPLPETATIGQVMEQVFKTTSLDDDGKILNFSILEIRQVYIDNISPIVSTAVLVRTNVGERIVILRYEGKKLGWWNRIYHIDRH